MTEGQLRLLRSSDLNDAMALSRSAGWNQTIDDWKMLLHLAPESCFGIELDHHIVATTTLLCYGVRLAWVGMVLTKPEYRRRGLAKRLMVRALQRAAELKIEGMKLDATTDGQPLYEKLGFKTEQIIERWYRDAVQEKVSIGTTTIMNTSPSMELDAQAFGADRRSLFRELAKRNPPCATKEAFCFFRNGSHANYLGPCVATHPSSARDVIEQSLRSSPQCNWYWDLLSSNKPAHELALALGFVPQRRLERMASGDRVSKNDGMTYAIAGFELG